MKRKISPEDVTPIQLEGRSLSWVINNETVGAEQLSVAVMHCFPNAVVKPLHAQRDIEEVIYILSGKGEAWIDGELVAFTAGDSDLLEIITGQGPQSMRPLPGEFSVDRGFTRSSSRGHKPSNRRWRSSG